MNICVDHFFKAIQSKRRLKNLTSINAGLAPLMTAAMSDPFASIRELDGFAIYAGDGHYHAAAVHDLKRPDRKGKPRKEAAGHFCLLDLRTHFLSHLTSTDQSGARKREHDMHAIKRLEVNALRGGQPKGTKVILACRNIINIIVPEKINTAMDTASSWARPFLPGRRVGDLLDDLRFSSDDFTENPAWFRSRTERER